MATLVLAAAGAALGSSVGGTVLGLTGAVIGRAVGATLGRAIDQRLLGAGAEPVQVGRMDRLRLMGAGEGAPLPLVWGRVRLGGQVIWASSYTERRVKRGGSGKGAPPQPATVSYSYSVSLAVALCEGVVTRVGRVWADGVEIDAARFGMRVYPGSETQLPDPAIAAAKGAGEAPAYRGVAYVVFENLPLGEFGNRVPQFSFEVFRAAQGALADAVTGFAADLKGVALIPGTGEYALATTPVRYATGLAAGRTANVNTPSGLTDFALSLRQLREEVPSVGSVSLVVSWFGGDLRCGSCKVQPKVEQRAVDGKGMPWRAGGIARVAAAEVPRLGGKSVYGGTPADTAVIEAIRAIRAGGQEVMFYPFVLMDQLAGNVLPDPWSGSAGQAALPWRGRITLSVAPGREGSPDGTADAGDEVARFFGQAQAAHFGVANGTVTYSGPAVDWGFRRFILHYAKLCALAGGVDSFCIGSEFRGLTAIRGVGGFPAVDALRALAADVRAILGPDVKIGYAADWSEYAGLARGGDRYFQLDPLWADANIDFIGIDNYMPLSDWREGEAQADAGYGSIHDLGYLAANIAGGEGFDWYYDSPEGEAAQRRLPIADDEGEPWVWRVKDLKGWWSNPHHERIGGVRSEEPTAWVPGSKPFRFTEYGCAAIDRGTNQPNLFIDANSSESALPRASRAMRDDLGQMQYYRAMAQFWGDVANNPVSALYGGPMVDMDHAHAWAWDARPFPAFPGRGDLWGDAGSYARGHWLNGRVTAQPMAAVVAEIAGRAGLDGVDVDDLHGLVRGYALGAAATGRAALQPLMLAAGFDACERGGTLAFRSRGALVEHRLAEDALVAAEEEDFEITRGQVGAEAGRLRVSYVEAEADYAVRVTEAALPDEEDRAVQDQGAPLVLLPDEARGLAERWLAETRVAQDGVRFALPPSKLAVGAGEVVSFAGQRWRIDRVLQGEVLEVEAVRVEPGVYIPALAGAEGAALASYVAPSDVYPVFLDLPLIKGTEVPHAPHVAAIAEPWPGRVGVWVSEGEDDFALDTVLTETAVIGVTETPLVAARAGLWDRGEPLRVRMEGGALGGVPPLSVLNGANLAAIGDGTSDRWELFQFTQATLVAPETWELSGRLRGQCGTDGLMPEVWPVGSTVVLVNDALEQVNLPPEARGLARTWRIGAALRGYVDPAVVVRSEDFIGAGLRPYPVAHLRVTPQGADRLVTWIRRTRVDGDSWQSTEAPLGEEREAYLLRVTDPSGAILRQVEVTQAQWTYPAAWWAADGAGALVAVAQLSARFGAGPFRSVTL